MYVLDSIFRANPAYELVLFDRLTDREKEALADLGRDPELYGVLRPRAPGLNMKSVSRDAALLFFTLAQPGRLPGYVLAQEGAAAAESVVRMVFDDFLQIEVSGKFVSGAAAHDFLCPSCPDIAPHGAIPNLSLDALHYAQRLDVNEATTLSAKLYFYNRLPASPQWKSRVPHDFIRTCWGIGKAHNQDLLGRQWEAWLPGAGDPPWLFWRRPHEPSAPSNGFVHKLYISPRFDHLQFVFEAALQALTQFGASSFKIGRDIYGILRPDKFVAYFNGKRELKEAADSLRRTFADLPGHGVPFTAAIGDGGLLSWGVDPPRVEHLLSWQGPSWRRWVTDRLAANLIAAKSSPPSRLEPWRFALERLRLEGVDTESWTPKEAIWGGS